MREVTRFAWMIAWLAGAGTASAATFGVSGIYSQACWLYSNVQCGPPNLIGIAEAPSFSLNQTYSGSNTHAPDAVTTSAMNRLFIEAVPGMFHLEAESSFSFSMVVQHGLPQFIGYGEARVYNLDARDVIHFASGTLSAGTPISYQITAVLDSTITGPCNPGGVDDIATFILWNLPGTSGYLTHSNCGQGSGHMTSSGTFTSTVGGSVEILSQFRIQSLSACGGGASVQPCSTASTVNASNTGAVYITALTPGVTFTSDSGSSYSAVPEPGTVTLGMSGVLMLVLRRIWRG